MKAKWFYPAQKQASEELDKRYADYTCDYQMLSKNRIVEQYSCIPKSNSEGAIPVLVTILKHGKDNISVFIYEAKFVQGWHVQDFTTKEKQNETNNV